ncbi:MAG: GntR family transcriptional regulator [Bacillota bacterium]|nr:GntR family transcriptional regulator [Bacillota bacterium]
MEITIVTGKPIYVQIIDGVRKAIARGDVVTGEKIASQRELASQLNVNPNTVQRAYRDMESLGLVKTVRGEGTYVSDDPALVEKVRDEMAIEAMVSFFEEMVSLGFGQDEIGKMVQKALEEYPKR